MTYREFLENKIDIAPQSGIEVDPAEISPALKDHQRVCVLWALRGGRRGLFARFGLGKTVMQLEWCRILQKHIGGQTLIVMPLNVMPEFRADAVHLLGLDEPPYCRTMAEVKACQAPIILTNYERVRDGDIDPHYFTAVSLDEAATLRSFGSKTYRFLQQSPVIIDILYMDTESEVLLTLQRKWRQYDELSAQMEEIIKTYGLGSLALEALKRTIGCERVEVTGKNYTAINNDCVEEVRSWPADSIDLYVTSIPFGNHYEYSPSYNDFGHNPDDAEFFKQMDYLTPELLRTLKPGRVAAIHVKDRVQFGNVTGMGMPTIEPFHADCISHFIRHGFAYFGMITVVTDVVRENNQTYRLGWTEQCKDGTKMGVGCPEYILLFRKLPTDHSKGYADVRVSKDKANYTRAQWQIDAHAFWRSSGDRPFGREDLERIPVSKLQSVYRKYSRGTVYDYNEHVKLAEELDKDGRLPSTFMVVAPGSWDMTVWDDINRMRTLNTSQSRRRQQMHVCPLQLDIVERLINRYSNPGDLVADPFAGLFTVPYLAVKMGRKGKGVELNPDYFRDGVGYCETADAEQSAPTLFDLMEEGEEAAHA